MTFIRTLSERRGASGDFNLPPSLAPSPSPPSPTLFCPTSLPASLTYSINLYANSPSFGILGRSRQRLAQSTRREQRGWGTAEAPGNKKRHQSLHNWITDEVHPCRLSGGCISAPHLFGRSLLKAPRN